MGDDMSALGTSLRCWERSSGLFPAGTRQAPARPKIKIGKKVFYDLGKLPEWLASREIPTTRITGQN